MKDETYSFSPQEYGKLVEQMLNSLTIDEVIAPIAEKIVGNSQFYLMLFKTVEVFRLSETSKGHQNIADKLNELKVKIYEYFNGIPLGLPQSVVADKKLKDCLGDYRGYIYDNLNLRTFQNEILEKVNSIPQKFGLLFLYWCEQMLEVNYAKHRMTCKSPLDCPINQGYDGRIQYIIRLIEDMTHKPEKLENVQSQSKKYRNKIQWLGTQKELAELFVELKKKGWIEKFENETILDCFTESNSVPHYLKPGTDTKTGENTFENLYTGYAPQFYGIKENPKRHK